jgi:hypothetical protein
MDEFFRRTAMKLIGAGTAAAAGLGSVSSASAQEDTARIRALHAIPDAPNVTVTSDHREGLPAIPISYEDVTPFVAVEPGTITFTVTPENDDYDPITQTVRFEGGTSYTVVAVGEFSEGTARLVLLEEAPEAGGPRPGSTATVRLFNAIPDQDQVDLTVTVSEQEANSQSAPSDFRGDILDLIGIFRARAPGLLPAFVRSRIDTPGLLELLTDVPAVGIRLTWFDDVQFGEASDYFQVPSGEYGYSLRSSENPEDEVFEVGRTTFESDTVYTLFAVGYRTTEDEPVDAPNDVIAVPS